MWKGTGDMLPCHMEMRKAKELWKTLSVDTRIRSKDVRDIIGGFKRIALSKNKEEIEWILKLSWHVWNTRNDWVM